MKFLCNCGHVFTCKLKDDEQQCPECGSDKEEHLPEIATPLTDENE